MDGSSSHVDQTKIAFLETEGQTHVEPTMEIITHSIEVFQRWAAEHRFRIPVWEEYRAILVLIQKAVSYWEIKSKEVFPSLGSVRVIWWSVGDK